MTDLAARIARLSPEQRRLLGRMTADPAAGPPAPARVLGPELLRTLHDGAAATGSLHKASVRRFYDTVSEQLDGGLAGRYAQFLNYGYQSDGRSDRTVHVLPEHVLNRNCVQLVLEVVGDWSLSGRRVLDVGCGRGGTVDVLARYCRPAGLVGLDLSPAAIAFCLRTQPRGSAEFVCGDAESLPFAANSFDAVTNVESSHSYPDIGAFYREVHRVLKPGGAFLYTDTVPTTDLPGRLREITALGMELELERDITGNVLGSCDAQAVVHAGAFAVDNDASMLGDFLAVPGSDNYERLRSGRLTYGIWRFRKAGA